MPCSHSGGDGGADKDRLSKRDFMKAAVAIGGASAVTAVSAHTANTPRAPREQPSGQFTRHENAQRQHAWDAFLQEGTKPAHHLLLHLDYAKDGVPTEQDREQVAETFGTFEEAFEWSHRGLIFTVGYSREYFDRFDEDLPDGIDLWYPQDIIDEVDIDQDEEITAETDDVHVHLTSDHPQAVLEAEQAIRGEADSLNGVDLETDLSDVFEVVDRRTGFVDQRFGGIRKAGWGRSKPHNRFGEDVPGDNPVPRDAPVFFGFKSTFEDSQPHEDEVTINDPDNPFSGGTTVKVSMLKDDVEGWYENHDHQEQVDRMYSPHHDNDRDTGTHGRELGPRSGTEEEPMIDIAQKVDQDAEEKGVVGHAQKIARSRDPSPPVLRRDFPSTHENHPHLQWISHQQRTQDFVDVRKSMSFLDPDGDEDAADELPLEDHGILNYITVRTRGIYLLPPRRHRALPRPNPEE